ncbi:MAG: DUF4291 domain-containing protein [Dinghuibacter sp.]|nr:DUF4291 domain-containing protein [Dinghuibacter sp.]
MNIATEPYVQSVARLPKNGQHIVAHRQNGFVVVYQAYNKAIAGYAVEHQQLGGTHFSYNRMSWIKPNFLWMMYRCGWAGKENQERVLALWISEADFEHILAEAVPSSYKPGIYATHEDWQVEMAAKEVRLQWDPDHDPYGQKQNRRAIQLGLKGRILEQLGRQMVKKIEDITGFVHQQKALLDAQGLEHLLVPVEEVYTLTRKELAGQIGVSPFLHNSL